MKIHIPTPLRQFTGKQDSVNATGATVGEVLDALATQFPAGNPLAAQLQTVARIIKVRGALGLSRQIFFCELDGFDTHSGQLAIQSTLLQQLSQAVLAFYQATQELGVDQYVTTFTASEFGRSLAPNSTGTDHAWGSHHFVIGTGVKPRGMAIWAQIATTAVAMTTAMMVFQATPGACHARRVSCL